jgi:hypothetical protein
MRGLVFWLLVLAPGLIYAQNAGEGAATQKFISGGRIRLHLEAGGYTVTPTDGESIMVSCRANTWELKRVKVQIKRAGASADVYVSDTPNSNFRATIEVPRRSNLWVRLSAGEMVVEDVEGDKDVQVFAGRIRIDIPHPEQYGHREASVTTGSLKSSAFEVSKGGLFRSFEQRGPGKYSLHAHVITGEIDLRGSN